jgi:hypothetical protein
MHASRITTAAAIFLFSASAYAGVYKCKTAQGKTEYSDLPCAGAANTGIQNSPTTSSTENPNARALGIYVQEALAQKDFKRAKWLASIPEHFEMIRVAEEEESKRRKARFDRATKIETVSALNRGNAINKANGEKLDENNRLQAEANRHLEDLKNKPSHCRTFVTGRHADTRCD